MAFKILVVDDEPNIVLCLEFHTGIYDDEAQRYGTQRSPCSRYPQASLARLEAAVEQLPEPEKSAQVADDEPAVSLPHRALPLIELLKAAAKAKCDVMWDSNN